MSPRRMPRDLSSVLLVRRIDRLWALRFCLGWRPAKAEPLLLPPSPGIPPTTWEALPPAQLLPEDRGRTDPTGEPAAGWSAISTCMQIKPDVNNFGCYFQNIQYLVLCCLHRFWCWCDLSLVSLHISQRGFWSNHVGVNILYWNTANIHNDYTQVN